MDELEDGMVLVRVGRGEMNEMLCEYCIIGMNFMIPDLLDELSAAGFASFDLLHEYSCPCGCSYATIIAAIRVFCTSLALRVLTNMHFTIRSPWLGHVPAAPCQHNEGSHYKYDSLAADLRVESCAMNRSVSGCFGVLSEEFGLGLQPSISPSVSLSISLPSGCPGL